VLSVRQSDVRVVARELAEYLHDLPGPEDARRAAEEGGEVPFWTDLARHGTVRLPFFGRTGQIDAVAVCAPLAQMAQEHGRVPGFGQGQLGRGIWFSLPVAEGERAYSLFGFIPTEGGWLLVSGRTCIHLSDPRNLRELAADLLERWPDAAREGET